MSEKKAAPAKTTSLICENRRARFAYELLEFYDGGLVLLGSEVKSLRAGGGHVNEAYASFSRGELWLVGSHIAPYKFSTGDLAHEERRSRKILLNAKELKKIKEQLEQKGLTLVPLKLFWNRGKVKVALALGRGKKLVDKRRTVMERETKRKLAGVLKGL